MQTTAASQNSHQFKDSFWYVFLPNVGGWFFVYLMLGFLFLRPELLLWDGGSCRLFLNGLYSLQHFALPIDNYTSTIYPDIDCQSRSWLGDVVMGLFFQAGQLNGIVLACALAIALSLTWSYQLARKKGLGAMSGLLMLVIVMAAAGVHWSTRCHVFSYLPMLVVYYFCFVSKAGKLLRIAGTTVTLALAANIHGSFTISLFVVAAKLIGDALT
ncbi:MAG: hypothetical protein ACRD3W_03395, partial [Terriglobales bacterium]